MCNFSIISMLQDLKKKNFKHSDYTTATPNTIYMYIRLPIENVIYCVTYNVYEYKTNSNLFYKVHHGNKTLHNSERGTTECFLYPLWWFIVHPSLHLYIYLFYQFSHVFCSYKVFFVVILNSKLGFVISKTRNGSQMMGIFK